jgi:excisionase family DNA binding protein
MADSREVMNIRQASQYLGVSPDTLYKYVNEQKIPVQVGQSLALQEIEA